MPGTRRREFVALLGGVVAAWPLAVPAQQEMLAIGYTVALDRAKTRNICLQPSATA